MSQRFGQKVTSVSMLYHPSEDRLMLITGLSDGAKFPIFATRRLVSRLVSGFAQLLERTSSAAQEVPSSARDDVIMFEHHSALEARKTTTLPVTDAIKETIGQGSRKGKLPPPILLEAVEIKLRDETFVLNLKALKGRPIGHIEASREDLHRLLGLLHKRSEEANWRLSDEVKWLNEASEPMILN